MLLRLLFVIFLIEGSKSDHAGNQNKVDKQHRHRTPEAQNVATADAFAEENAVVVVVLNANKAIFTVVHVCSHLNLAIVADPFTLHGLLRVS